MFTLTALRPAFAAAFSALLLAVFVAVFLVPNGAIVCDFGAGIREPTFSHARRWNGSETDVVVTITREGHFLVGSAVVPSSQLEQVLADAYARDRHRQFVLVPDVRSPFGAVRFVLRKAQSLGIRRIVIPSGLRSVGAGQGRA